MIMISWRLRGRSLPQPTSTPAAAMIMAASAGQIIIGAYNLGVFFFRYRLGFRRYRRYRLVYLAVPVGRHAARTRLRARLPSTRAGVKKGYSLLRCRIDNAVIILRGNENNTRCHTFTPLVGRLLPTLASSTHITSQVLTNWAS